MVQISIQIQLSNDTRCMSDLSPNHQESTKYGQVLDFQSFSGDSNDTTVGEHSDTEQTAGIKLKIVKNCEGYNSVVIKCQMVQCSRP